MSCHECASRYPPVETVYIGHLLSALFEAKSIRRAPRASHLLVTGLDTVLTLQIASGDHDWRTAIPQTNKVSASMVLSEGRLVACMAAETRTVIRVGHG